MTETSQVSNQTSAVPNIGSRLSSEALLQRLLTAQGFAFDRGVIRRIIRESGLAAGSTSSLIAHLQQLADALQRLGLRATIQTSSNQAAAAPDIAAALQQGLPVVLAASAPPTAILADSSPVAPENWLLLQQAYGRKVRVAQVVGSDQWIPLSELSLSSPAGPAGQVAWLRVEGPLAVVQSDSPPAKSVKSSAKKHASHDDHQGSHHASMSPWARLISILRPELGDIWVVAVFATVVGMLGLATPIAIEALVNTVAFGRFMQPVVIISIMLLGFLSFAAILRGLQTYIAEIIQRRIFVRIVADLAYRLPRADKSALESHQGPELINRFFDVMTVQKSAALLVLDGIAIVIQTTIGMGVLAFYHPLLAGFDLILLLALGITVFVLGRGAVKTSIQESIAKYSVAAWLEELAQFPTTFKTVSGLERALDQADRLTVDYLTARKQHFRILLRQITFSLGLQALAGSVILGIGGWLVIDGKLTLGQLVAAELIVALIVGSFAKLGKQMESFYDLMAAVDKIGHLLDLPMERSQGESLPATSQGVGINAQHMVLIHGSHGAASAELNFQIVPGQLVALLGPAGSGKSVLLEQLFGLKSPASGVIELDGTDLRSLQPTALRGQAALVRLAEITTGSIAENIHFNRLETSYAQVREILQDLDLLDELQHLPDGLETQLSPVGSPLSDSQASRLVLARALAGRPRLLLLDGLLDSLSDQHLAKVFIKLRSLSPVCTIILATGRSDIAQQCDQAIWLGGSGHGSAAPENRHSKSATVTSAQAEFTK